MQRGAVEDEAAEAAALRAAYALAYPALPLPSRATDAFLLRFLRGRKFNRERALTYIRWSRARAGIMTQGAGISCSGACCFPAAERCTTTSALRRTTRSSPHRCRAQRSSVSSGTAPKASSPAATGKGPTLKRSGSGRGHGRELGVQEKHERRSGWAGTLVAQQRCPGRRLSRCAPRTLPRALASPSLSLPTLRPFSRPIPTHPAYFVRSCALARCDREGCLVLYVRVKHVDLDNNSILAYFRVMMWILDHVRAARPAPAPGPTRVPRATRPILIVR